MNIVGLEESSVIPDINIRSIHYQYKALLVYSVHARNWQGRKLKLVWIISKF